MSSFCSSLALAAPILDFEPIISLTDTHRLAWLLASVVSIGNRSACG
jgi:hypothetical protein